MIQQQQQQRHPKGPLQTWILVLVVLMIVMFVDGFVVVTTTTTSRAAAKLPWETTTTLLLRDTWLRKSNIRVSVATVGNGVGVGPLFLFGGSSTQDKKNVPDKKTLELARWEGEASLGPASKYNSCVEFVRLWSHGLELGGNLAKKLSTPVVVVTTRDNNNNNNDLSQEDGVDSCAHVRLLFQKVNNIGYQDKDDNKNNSNSNNNKGSSRKKDKKEQVKPGGVEILVEKLSTDTLRMRVRRCEMDDETVVKEMSEETIVEELQQALRVWRKEQSIA